MQRAGSAGCLHAVCSYETYGGPRSSRSGSKERDSYYDEKDAHALHGNAFEHPGARDGSVASRPRSTRGNAGPSSRQQHSSRQQARITVVTNRVIVPVTVKNRDGGLVADLQRDDFRVFADGMEQKILTFTAEPSPLSAVILVDNDLAQKQAEEVQKSLTAISAGFGPSDEAALVTYSEYATVLQEFSSNNDDLFTKLKRMQIGQHSASVATGPTSTPVPVINGNTSPTSAPQTGLGIPLHGSGRYQTDTALDDALVFLGGHVSGPATEPAKNRVPDFRRQQFPAKPAHIQ